MHKSAVTYKQAGVDITQGNEMVKKIKPLVAKTHRKEVMGGLGGFGALFALDILKYKQPVLVSGTDGVGTKLAVAHKLNKHDTVGIDCVAMCVNDILVSGAEPLFFLDYLAVGRLEAKQAVQIVAGVAEGCAQAGCALIGGETAEMPGFYKQGEYDIAGFAVGVVEKSMIIDGKSIVPEDVIIGVASSGLHSNGYSLARKIFFEQLDLKPEKHIEVLGCSLGEELMRPTKIYVGLIRKLINDFKIKGMAHITGGGLLENPPRVLPKGTHMQIEYGSWEVPAIFKLMMENGPVDTLEMLRTFNMGIGYVIVVDANDAPAMLKWFENKGEKAWAIGKITTGEPGVTIRGLS